MHQTACDPVEPLVRVLAGQVAIAGVEVDADGRTFDQFVYVVQAVGRFAVLLMALQPKGDAARLGDFGRLLEGVAHE